MAWLSVAKVVYVVVEMVEKVVVEVGFLEFLGGKEEEKGGVEVVLLLEMEEEMEGRMVEELVAEMVVEMEGRVVENRPKEGAWGCFGLPWFVSCWLEREGKENERKRRR